MSKYRLDSLAELARQLEYAPAARRISQVSAAEELLHDLDPAKAYPYSFVVYRITGYHPKDEVTADLLTGLALQHDLGVLIEQLSDSLNLPADSAAEPVLTIEQVGERFNVTSKTIQRWRRRGLPGRRFVFADGKRRVGFLVSSVERFFATHQDQVTRGMNFSQVDAEENELILRQARRLATQCRCCVNEIARRIGRKLNRSPITILHTIRRHDQANPQRAVFPSAPEVLSVENKQSIARTYRRGATLAQLACRYGRTKAAIYRIVVEQRLERLNRRKVKFIDDPLYHQADAADAVEAIVRQESLADPQKGETLRVPKDLPAYLQELYRVPLLTATRERGLFLKFNYHKFQFVQVRRRTDPQLVRGRDLQRMERQWKLASETRNAIVRANLRLVVSVARKHLRPGLDLMELVSDGNLTLMRAVESFDVHRGYRFSTYATLVLMKGFARSVPLMRAGRLGGQVDVSAMANVADQGERGVGHRMQMRDQLHQLMKVLNERERNILLSHFGVGDRQKPVTFEQMSRRMGLTSQRVRQIEQSALAKLREIAVHSEN
ncbi:MAG: sigma-70 family RNA polymerase sigma factor [Phycisphaerales bacterium]|nr:sigma-70 family RNA polymerase sigma factor [Phycisphaerales bacterium]